MADGQQEGQLSGLNSSLGRDESEPSSSGKHYNCRACSNPVKDHPGPHGLGKCLVRTLSDMQDRMARLEAAVEEGRSHHADELGRIEKIHQARVEGLLATISVLEDRLDSFERQSGVAGHYAAVVKGSLIDEVACEVGEEAPSGQPTGTSEPAVVVDANTGKLLATNATGCQDQSLSAAVKSAPERGFGVMSGSQGGLFASAAVTSVAGSGSSCSNGTLDLPRARASSPTRDDSGDDGAGQWQVQRRKGKQAGAGDRSRNGGLGAMRSKLHGAGRVDAVPFHLAGISPDCCASDVEGYCAQRGVRVARVFLFRSRAWGTLSAKLFVAKNDSEKILAQSFWPELIRCRSWEKDPPRGRWSATN